MPAASNPEGSGGEIDVVGSTVDLVHPPNSQDGRTPAHTPQRHYAFVRLAMGIVCLIVDCSCEERGGVRHPWQLSAVATTIATRLGPLEGFKPNGVLKHKAQGAKMPTKKA